VEGITAQQIQDIAQEIFQQEQLSWLIYV
jgi:predicted Zn-dependent peptidase